ncbi:MAG TPA: ATP-grasp domain-containing protein [Thermoanaerobaculia bacterium]|nr:ATP-grasp domain-containing protein [Thermoanaerobaculia bacterium]
MKVLLISPGYPGEMPNFARGLAEVGAEVLGVGDQAPGAIPEPARSSLSAYLQVRNLWAEQAVAEQVRDWLGSQVPDRVECLWEPGVLLAAGLRETLGLPGLTREQAFAFRNKERMKQVLDAAGIRTPRHISATTAAACWEAAEVIGFPLILKPIAGAGSADTYRVHDPGELKEALSRLRHVPEVSVEEFVDGEEFTFDTVSIDGVPAYYNIAWYRPRPLVARSTEWISPQVVALRHVDQADLADGVAMGRAVLEALGFESGFTHMEWYRKADGEVVFGEIGARPPGAHQVDQMNFACDIDVFRGWAEAICFKRFSENVQRLYNVANVYKRAEGTGLIHHIHGYEHIRRLCGPWLVWDNLLPVGARRRDWRNTLVSDGFLVVRHPELSATLRMADEIGSRLRMYAS